VTILVAELVGSAALFGRLGDEAADAVRREQLERLRRHIGAHGGREVRSTGGGLVAAFPSAVEALRCAIELRDEAGELPVRAGLDAGEPPGEGDDLHGTPVIVATGLCDAAGAGEILVSEVVRQVAGRRVAGHLRPAGALRIPGVGEPVTVATVRQPGEAAPEPAPATEITVVIADDQALLRTGFRVILDSEPDLHVVGEAGDGRAAVDVVRRRRPDVVLMDIRMPELDGLRAAERILADPDLHTAVLMLTTFDVGEYVYEALRIGASGFLLKDAPAARLLDAVRVAAAGDAMLEPSITRRLIERFARVAQPAPGAVPAALAELTARELEVLRLLARGLSNAEIAAQLVLGENTVKTHVARLLSKLGLRDRVQAVVIAYETGFVEPELAPSDPPPR